MEVYGLNDSGDYNIGLTKIPETLRPGIYNPSPANGASITAFDTSLSWNSVAGATGYDIYFGENVTKSLEKIGSNLQSPSISVNDLEGGGLYYWHITAKTSTGNIEGPYWWFNVYSPPCPVCNGDAVVVENITITGSNCQCSAGTSISVGPRVSVKSGATVTFRAPTVKLLPGFHAEEGAVVHIKQQ